MYVLAWRDGVSGYRFILIGIGVAAFFDGLIGYVLTRAAAVRGPAGACTG